MQGFGRWLGVSVLAVVAALPLGAQSGRYYEGLKQGYQDGYNDHYDHRRYDAREEYNRTHGGLEPGALPGGAALVTSTVHEAWVLSGRNDDQFFAMVRELATLSASKRGLSLPDSEAAGKKAGELIKKAVKKDPDQLLYVVVDEAVRKTGVKSAAVEAQASSMK